MSLSTVSSSTDGGGIAAADSETVRFLADTFRACLWPVPLCPDGCFLTRGERRGEATGESLCGGRTGDREGCLIGDTTFSATVQVGMGVECLLPGKGDSRAVGPMHMSLKVLSPKKDKDGACRLTSSREVVAAGAGVEDVAGGAAEVDATGADAAADDLLSTLAVVCRVAGRASRGRFTELHTGTIFSGSASRCTRLTWSLKS